MTQQNRLQSGGRIDRSKPLTFTYNGKQYKGYQGDTLASAILANGTDAVTRVIIDSEDGQGRRWATVGVSANIVDASFEALLDAMNWKLIRDGVKPV